MFSATSLQDKLFYNNKIKYAFHQYLLQLHSRAITSTTGISFDRNNQIYNIIVCSINF